MLRQRQVVINNLWMTDEAWFHLSGYVNAQNTRTWASENPHMFHESPLHPAKIGVWAAISKKRIFFTFFTEAVNTRNYLSDLFAPFSRSLSEEERSQGWFQQDGATAHTSNLALTEIRGVFGNRIISRRTEHPWPARSPDLTAPDFYLWGKIKGSVYKNNPKTIEDLKTAISLEINAIDTNELERVMRNVMKRVKICKAEGGRHFQHLL